MEMKVKMLFQKMTTSDVDEMVVLLTKQILYFSVYLGLSLLSVQLPVVKYEA